MIIEILEYLDDSGRSPYGKWFNKLDAKAAAKVAVVIDRIGKTTNPGNVEERSNGINS